jgi:ubiquinone/menaquinone biosynthesis C-methylase UbiE
MPDSAAERQHTYASHTSLLIAEYPELFLRDAGPVREIRARHSRIDEFTARAGGRPILVKTITECPSPEHAALVAGGEYAALVSLRDRLSPAMRSTVPEPLGWVPGTAALAMSKLDGEPIYSLVHRFGTKATWWASSRLATVGQRTGEWLRQMHDATRSEPAPIDGEALLQAMTTQAELAESRGWSAAAAVRALQCARAAIHRFGNRPVSRAARQGDFGLSNILSDRHGRIHVVDFENFAEADAVYEDVAAFTSYLRLLATFPVYSRRALAAMRRAFLRGYGQVEADPMLALYELKQAVAMLAEFHGGRSIVARLRRRRIAVQVAGMAESLDLEVVRYRSGGADFRDVSSYHEKRYQGRDNEFKRRAMADAYLGLLGSIDGQLVLDVGCGTGRGFEDLARSGARLVGSDASVDMLGEASRACPDGPSPLLAAAYAQHLPFVDGAFDTVVSLNFLHLFTVETQRRMVQEMKRVLKPGGRLLLEFDNALHGGIVGPFKRWTDRERGSLPGEIRTVLGDDCEVTRCRGAVYPVIWRVLSRAPRFGAAMERLAYLPGVRHLAHRLYYEVRKPGPVAIAG